MRGLSVFDCKDSYVVKMNSHSIFNPSHKYTTIPKYMAKANNKNKNKKEGLGYQQSTKKNKKNKKRYEL